MTAYRQILAYELPFQEDALVPFMDAPTLHNHNHKYYVSYRTRLMAALNHYPQLNDWPAAKLVAAIRLLPQGIRRSVRNYGGGTLNHELFYQTLKPHGPHPVPEPLYSALCHRFGSWMRFREEFSAVAAGRFGVGWCWLILAQEDVFCYSTVNQDHPYMPHIDNPGVPLLGLDLWEHAYYATYENRRPEYILSFWDVIDWERVNARYVAALASRAQSALLPTLTDEEVKLLRDLQYQAADTSDGED